MVKFKTIRGARVLQQIDETSIEDLRQNIEQGFPKTTKRQYATDPVHIVSMKMQPFTQTGDLKIDASAKSGEKVYNPEIIFNNVEFSKEDTDSNITFVGSDNEEYNITPINLANKNVKVKCNCMDFRWRFAVWNSNDDSLIGNPPPPYRKKTDRAPANPQRVPGVCKHLIKTISALRDAGMVTG